MLKAICFDLDGTLLAARTNFQETILRNFTSLLDVPKNSWKIFETELLTIFPSEHIASSEEAVRLALSRHKLVIPSNITALCAEGNQHYFETSKLMAGTLDMLEFLKSKNIPLAIITNGPADMQLGSIKHLKIDTYFKALLASGSADVNVRKPDKKIFELALAQLDTRPKETLMIGDNPVADIQGALNAGMQAMQIGFREPKPEGIKRLKDILELHNHLQIVLS